MKKALIALLAGCLAVLLSGSLSARDATRPGLRPERPWAKEEFGGFADPSLVGLAEEAAVDTYCLVWYDFEVMSWQGWSQLDFTAQRDTFFHVDDFLGLSGGDFGRLHAIEGAKSMWCGERPNASDPYVCSWEKAPGYGNNWEQVLSTGPITYTGTLSWSFHLRYDSEPDYDFTYAEHNARGDDWTSIAEYTGFGDRIVSYFLPGTTVKTKLRFHFTSDDVWSDEDGLWNTDGGCIVDSITVSDGGAYYNFENFESASLGSHWAGIWRGGAEAAFGTHSGLKANLYMADSDPCNKNLATQIVFFLGGLVPSPTYPGLYTTPFCTGDGGITAPCQNEVVYSPVIDMTKYSLNCNSVQNGTIPPEDLPQLGGTLLRFTVYTDLPLPNLVFYQWFIRNIDETGCPGLWQTENTIYWAGWGAPEYVFFQKDVSSLVTEDKVQVAVGVIDMCDEWYMQVGNCAQHTPAPWFDNVRLYRYKASGPQWSYRDIDLFQDNFPVEEYQPWGTVRADAAIDLLPNNAPRIDPGDSIVVSCTSNMGGGIDTMPNGYPAVYLHVNAHWIGVGSPPELGAVIHGAQLQGSCGLWLSTDGGGWDIIQGDCARTRAGAAAGRYMFDLNDSLFVPGYIIEYYFTANDNAGIESALPKWARSTGPYFEFTCLPTGMSTTLFVDDASGRGSWKGVVQDYWDAAFRKVLIFDPKPDRYDVNGPSSGVSNGLGSRANPELMRDAYTAVIWDSGDLESVTISDGTYQSDKSNDCQLLIDWMYEADHQCGLWICGDNVAYDLTVNDGLSAPALALMNDWCGVSLVNSSYFDVTGRGVMNPVVIADSAGVFHHDGLFDQFCVYGGCPVTNRFDCLATTASGVHALDYPSYGGSRYYAGVQACNVNSMEESVHTLWFGFSFMYIRNDVEQEYPDYFEVLRRALEWLFAPAAPCVGPCGTEVPAACALAQNYPNPFNPVTTIKYDVKEKGLVTVKVYTVAGQLVRTLVNEVKPAGSYTVPWNGTNERGAEVASGIYFYKMETTGFGATRKMVLLR
jgi:hypothetical protein